MGLLNEWFQQNLPRGWIIRCQLPITTDRSEPEPDLAILKGTHSDYRHKHPVGSDCRLVIEIADTSLDKDRAKAAIYRDAGVQEYWIVNVRDKQLERFDFSATQDAVTQTAELAAIYTSGTLALKIGDSDIALELNEILG